uniref:Galectin n=1 Tax=Meloidogyne javanica TaxID=6303 RepID=A0A915N081_MELJA
MNSYIHNEGKWGENETYLNPIGLTGIYFSIRINVTENYFNITINQAAAKILYKHRLPVWATEWIMIKGDIDQIQFGEENEKCKRLLSSFKYPLNIIHVPDNNYLRDGSLIFIEGIIINKTISISFLHQALEWHEFIGQTIFQLNITKENATVGSYSNKQWLPSNCDKISQNKTFDNKCWHKHEFPNLNEGEEFNLNILVRTAKYIWRYKIGGNWFFYEHQMPAQDVQYITVRGLKQNPKYNYIIKLDKLY